MSSGAGLFICFVLFTVAMVVWFCITPLVKESGRQEAYREIVPAPPATEEIELLMREAAENPEMIPAITVKLADLVSSPTPAQPAPLNLNWK